LASAQASCRTPVKWALISPGGQPAGIQRQHHLINIGQPPLAFLDDLGFERARPDPRDLDLDRSARIGEHRFLALLVPRPLSRRSG
jgi:hypothetical protein